ncbi:hypothetical protein N9917_00900, partial [Deltaproteobacteria bacterium]|nr:hypothetical protein [Deltaproteobacteria bacterium]
MSVSWMWGWELGTIQLAYTNSGWVAGDLMSSGYGNMAYPNPHQPAAGYGGGRFCVYMGQDNGDRNTVKTPLSGQASVGSHDRFIYSGAYQRVGNTQGPLSQNSYILQFVITTGGTIKVSNTSNNTGTSALDLWIWDGVSAWVLLGTSITTYNDSSPYKRIVCDFDGPNGNYDLYVDGVLEISVSGSPETFTGMRQINWRGGANANIPSGGFHDHCVLFDAGNHSTGALVVDAIPNDSDTVLIGAQTYLWKTALTPLANEVLIGASAALSRENLINAINLGPGSGTTYAAATTLNADVYAEENLSTTSVDVTAILKGTNTTATTTPVNTAGITGWGAATISGGDLDSTNDLALALGDIYIQGLLPNADVVDGAFLNVNGANPGTNTDLYANIDDASDLTDFIETVTSPDANEFGHETRGDINGSSATGTMTVSGAPNAGDQVEVAGTTLTAAGVTSASQFDQTAGTSELVAQSILSALGLAGVIPATVTSSTNGSGLITYTAAEAGTGGN